MTAHHVPANLRQFALAVGIALGLSAAAGASVITEAPQVSASAKFVDHGGRVLSAAQVYPIYWGRYWAPGRSASPTSEEITRALRTVLAGSYQAELAQYRTIGAATIRGSRVITTSDPPSGFTDKDIQAFLDVQFDCGVFPAPDDQAIYVVTIPPGIYSSEYSSETDIVGEHSFYRRDGHRVHFAWITNSVVLDGATQTTTHEIVESLTDPEGTAILGIPGTCDEDDGARSPTSALTPASSTALWSRRTGRTSPVAASYPHRRPTRHQTVAFPRLRRRKHDPRQSSWTLLSPGSGRPTNAETARRNADPGNAGDG